MTGLMGAAHRPRSAGRVRRPHLWPCRHCVMVEDYRLTRDAQLRQAEGVYDQDEGYRLTTFKQWLQTFQWEQPREPADDTATFTATSSDSAPGGAGNDPVGGDALDRAQVALAGLQAQLAHGHCVPADTRADADAAGQAEQDSDHHGWSR
jgi:hypothetical protein